MGDFAFETVSSSVISQNKGILADRPWAKGCFLSSWYGTTVRLNTILRKSAILFLKISSIYQCNPAYQFSFYK